jgi:drug/metabolite transporter (DMT)-like permease
LKDHRAALVVLFGVATAWGASFTMVKGVLGRIAPEPFIFWRFLLGGILLCALAARHVRLTGSVVSPGIILGTLVFVGYWLQTRALIFISPSRSAFLTGLYVVLVPFCDRAVYHVRITSAAWAGSVLAAAGTAAMVGDLGGPPQLGDLLTLGCAVLFALHVVLSARYTSQHSSLGLAAVQVLFVGIAAAPATLFVPRPTLDNGVIFVIVFTAVVTTAAAFLGLMWGQARVSATEAAVILAFEPVAASLASIVWDHERLSWRFVTGAALILAAMVVSQSGTRRRHIILSPEDGER